MLFTAKPETFEYFPTQAGPKFAARKDENGTTGTAFLFVPPCSFGISVRSLVRTNEQGTINLLGAYVEIPEYQAPLIIDGVVICKETRVWSENALGVERNFENFGMRFFWAGSPKPY